MYLLYFFLNFKLKKTVKPRQVAIISNRTPLRTGKRKEIQCETTGSKPPANLYWILGKERLIDYK